MVIHKMSVDIHTCANVHRDDGGRKIQTYWENMFPGTLVNYTYQTSLEIYLFFDFLFLYCNYRWKGHLNSYDCKSVRYRFSMLPILFRMRIFLQYPFPP